jgi:hypothetical protein
MKFIKIGNAFVNIANIAAIFPVDFNDEHGCLVLLNNGREISDPRKTPESLYEEIGGLLSE